MYRRWRIVAEGEGEMETEEENLVIGEENVERWRRKKHQLEQSDVGESKHMEHVGASGEPRNIGWSNVTRIVGACTSNVPYGK